MQKPLLFINSPMYIQPIHEKVAVQLAPKNDVVQRQLEFLMKRPKNQRQLKLLLQNGQSLEGELMLVHQEEVLMDSQPESINISEIVSIHKK